MASEEPADRHKSCYTLQSKVLIAAPCATLIHTVQNATNLPPGCILWSHTARVQMQLNTASFYGNIETFEAVCIHSATMFDTTQTPCFAVINQINHDITQLCMLPHPLHAGDGLVLMQCAVFEFHCDQCNWLLFFLSTAFHGLLWQALV